MLYTVGHSNHDQSRFNQLLETLPSLTIIDTRSHPTSAMEHWRKEELEVWLANRYEWWPGLGGWTAKHLDLPEATLELLNEKAVDLSVYARGAFPKQRIAADKVAGGGPSWTNQGLYDYSFFTMLPEFIVAAHELLERCYPKEGPGENLAVMCCEVLWWKCHRSMIADYTVWAGFDAIHIEPHYRQKNKVKYVDGAKMTKHSSVIGNRLERYDPAILAAWERWRHAA